MVRNDVLLTKITSGGSAVGMATDYMLDYRRDRNSSSGRANNFHFSISV
jgi:hypothetical protein